MTELVSRNVDYAHDGTRMNGYVCAPVGAGPLPAILLIHDAFGLGEDMIAVARRLATLGYGVFAADVWGGRTTPVSLQEIGPLIGGMVSDRERWMGRVAAAHTAAAAQPELDASTLVLLGYCFGGASALEYLRTGGDVRGVASVHPGLDLLDGDWSAARASTPVLLCVGADDPMATAEMRSELQTSMSGAGIGWELDLYSDTKHAFTSPKASGAAMTDVVAYHPRNAERAWEATTRFLREQQPALTRQ